MKLLFGLFAALSLAAAALPAEAKSVDLAKFDGPGGGAVALSVSLHFPQSVVLEIENQAGDHLRIHRDAALFSKHDSNESGPVGEVSDVPEGRGFRLSRANREYRQFAIAQRLPAGVYEVKKITVTGTMDLTPLDEVMVGWVKPDLTFEVVEGKTTYLGRFEWIPMWRKIMLGIPYFKGWYIAVSDAADKDTAILAPKFPDLPPIERHLVTIADQPWIR